MAAKSGATDQAAVTKETSYASGVSGGSELAYYHSQIVSWDENASVNSYYALEDPTGLPHDHIDGLVLVTGRHEWLLTDGREFELITGSMTDDESSSFTLDWSLDRPSFALQATDDDTDYVELQGCKYTRVTISASKDDPLLRVSADFSARQVVDGSSFTPTKPSTKPLAMTNASLTLGGSAFSVDDASFEFEIPVNAYRDVSSQSTGEKRLITSLLPQAARIRITGTVSARRSLAEKLWGGSSMQDDRSSEDADLVFSAANSTNTLDLTFTDVRITSYGRVLDQEADLAQMTFEAEALDVSGSGTY